MSRSARAPHDIVPRRIFLDTCTFQALVDCGEFIFEGEGPPREDHYRPGTCPQVVRRADAVEILTSLQRIFLFNDRAQFDWIVSVGSLREVDAGDDRYRSAYVRDIIDHSLICLNENPPSELAERMAAHVSGPKCGFFSKKDKRLLAEAAAAECDVFLTIEKRLPRMADAVLREIPLLITTPTGLWALLEPHVGGS